MEKNKGTFRFAPVRAFLAALLAFATAPITAFAETREDHVTDHAPFRPSANADFDNLSDTHGIRRHEPAERSFIDADTEEVISPDGAAPMRPGYDFGGYWNTPYDESASARRYFDENLAMVGEPMWYELSAGARPLYPHWKYRIYLSTNAMDSSGNAVGASRAGSIDAFSVPAGMLRVDDNGTPADPSDDRTYIEAVDGAPLQLPRVTGRAGYLDDGLGTDGATSVNARAWGVRPGAYGWATGIVPLDSDGMTAAPPAALALGTANIGATRVHDGAPYFKNQDASSIAFPKPDPLTHSITLYLNWENRAKTYDVKLTSAYDGFMVSNAPTLAIKAVYDMPLLREKGGTLVASADETLRFFAPERIAGEGSEREHAYLFKGFRTQPNGLDGMQGDELIGARIARKGDDLRAEGIAVDAPFRLDAERPELFAVWGRPKSTLTLDLNGGSLVGVIGQVVPVVEGTRAFTLQPDAPTPNLPGPYGRVPVRPGYAFKGYYTKATGAGAAFGASAEDGTNEAYFVPGTGAAASKVVPTGLDWSFYTHTTLYAHWEYDIDFRLNHEADCASTKPIAASDLAHAAMVLMSGPLKADAPDRYGNRYPVEHAVLKAVGSELMATALSGTRPACEEKHLRVKALAGVPVKVPVAQGRDDGARTGSWQVRSSDAVEGEALATATGNRSDSYFTSALNDGVLTPTLPFPDIEPHAKTKTITAYAAWG